MRGDAIPRSGLDVHKTPVLPAFHPDELCVYFRTPAMNFTISCNGTNKELLHCTVMHAIMLTPLFAEMAYRKLNRNILLTLVIIDIGSAARAWPILTMHCNRS